MKKAGDWLAVSVRPLLLAMAIAAFFALLLWFQLGSLVPGLSESEVAQATASGTIDAIVANPLGLPHKALQYLPQFFDKHDPTYLRAAGTVFGLLAIGSLYLILRRWYTRRIALFGTLLFATSGWFLHTARLGTDDIMYTLLIAAAACVVWLQKSPQSPFAVVTAAFVLIGLLYIPGMVWFVVPALLWQVGRLARLLSNQYASFLTITALAVIGLIAPIAWALFQDPNLVKTYFGLPQSLPGAGQVLRSVLDVPIQLFFRGPHSPDLWLGRLPLLDWFCTVMFVFGVYAYFFKRKLDRTWFIAYVGIVGTVLVALDGPVHISILLPFVYLMIAGGIALMIQQWLTVFPRNPIARTLGVVLVTIAVLMSSYYNITHYFIAWPNTPETKATFQQHL